MNNPSVALSIIAKDKENIIERMLDSTKGVFDFYALQDTGSTDYTVMLFREWCIKNGKNYKLSKGQLSNKRANETEEYIYTNKDGSCGTERICYFPYVLVDGKKTLANFGLARQRSLELIPDDIEYLFWMDTDDILVNAEQIPQLAQVAKQNDIDLVFMQYNYAKGLDGIDPVKQKRERLINLSRRGGWTNWVHEYYKIDSIHRAEDVQKLGFNIYIDHLRSGFEAAETNRRNNLIMQRQLEVQGLDNFSDDMVHHLAFDHWEHREWDESIKFYNILLERYKTKAVPREAVVAILNKMAKAYMAMGNVGQSFEKLTESLSFIEDYPETYVLLMQLSAERDKWEVANFYADKVLKLGPPNTVGPVNDYEYFIQPLKVKMQWHIVQGQIEAALNIARDIASKTPSDLNAKNDYFHLQRENNKQLAARAFGEMVKYLQETNKFDVIPQLVGVLPEDLRSIPAVDGKIFEALTDTERKSGNIKLLGKKTIVFYAGPHYEEWDGNSDRNGGIGGSEGMCIQLARELALLGNDVFVYNECGRAHNTTIDGVVYKHHSTFDSNQSIDVFVSLRIPSIFNKMIHAKKQYLWLHDTEYGDVPLINFSIPNNVIVLSEYHKEIIKQNHGIVDDKLFWMSRNALNKDALGYVDGLTLERKPHQIIYASSYDRGLDNAVKIFEKVVNIIPDAELHIHYGWNGYDKMMDYHLQQKSPRGAYMANYKEQLIQAIGNTKNVYELGRISQRELYKKFAESAVWFYPTNFTEISCITAMTAQAMGAFPVCTPVAALNETVNAKYGLKVGLDSMVEALVYQLENQEEKKRKEMMRWARKEFDVKSLAKEWDSYFNNN